VSLRVDALIPTYRHLNCGSYNSILTMLNYTREQGVNVKMPALFSGGIIHHSRNQSLTYIRPNADFVLFVDDDMVPEKEHLCKLLKHELPAVSALTTTRVPPVELTIKAYDRESDRFASISDIKIGGVVSGDLCAGTGFLLVKKSVIDRVREYHLSASDWLFDNRLSLDRMGVSSEARAAEAARISTKRVRLAREKKVERIFDYYRDDEEREAGEDVSFCRKILLCNIPIAVDTTVWVGHLGERPFGYWDYDPTNDSTGDKPGYAEAAGSGADGAATKEAA
jgi:hypothetical protein